MNPIEPTPPSVAAQTEGLARSLSALIVESQALRTDVKANEQARKRENQINLGVLLMLSLFVLVVLVIAWQNNSITRQVHDTNDRITSCTVPGGRCYEESKARTGDAINAIIATQVAALECARNLPGLTGDEYNRRLEACVYERVQALSAKPPVTVVPTPSASPNPTPTP